MNAVEIEQAISDLAIKDFDRDEFPYEFLQAFGNKETTIKRLRSGSSNKSDIGGVLQANNIHILVAEKGAVTSSLSKLKESPATTKSKARFILATDGADFEAEDTDTGETVACAYEDFPDHFGFFLPLAGISTVQQVRESSFDIRATSRLNRLYVELLKDNPEWGSAERRPDMNHFMARLIFCFFAEDTDIFYKKGLFSDTVSQMSERDSSNTHEVISELFRAMNTKRQLRASEGIPRWADVFPYVNGGLFSGTTETPRFSKIARTYLIHTGSLDWTKINPDIFGSMIQAVTDEEERGSLGMHYTSVPNILKVLNPLFLDDLREKLDEAGDNSRTLLNLRKRISRIRVFDPACGSGNFLVIAYKQMREIENTINERRKEHGRKSEIPLTNFRGIELRDFPAEVARLALIIAEYQCDLVYRGQKEALQDFLPLSTENWITCGNALRIDWLSVCPPTGKPSALLATDLFEDQVKQDLIDFENEGGETYICGNPPYLGSTWQSNEQKADLQSVFGSRTKSWKSLDYVSAWLMKAADYGSVANSSAAFVTTNSICQGQQVPILWPMIIKTGNKISFAHTSFKWANLASHNAGVTVAIVGISTKSDRPARLYTQGEGEEAVIRVVKCINPYLVSAPTVLVERETNPVSNLPEMLRGNQSTDGGHLLLNEDEVLELGIDQKLSTQLIKRIYGSAEFIRGLIRYCLWIENDNLSEASSIPSIKKRIDSVKEVRLASRDPGANEMAKRPHQFRETYIANNWTVIAPRVSSETRQYLPVGLLGRGSCVSDSAFAIYDAPIWTVSIIASKLHLVWVATVCGRLKTDYRYSNTLGWNTFPIPELTEKNKTDLKKSAEDILLAREGHFPATIADLYDPENMPTNLREAHERNDEVLERIYIGRRFRNDTERLEKLFDLYTEMTKSAGDTKKRAK